MMKPVEPSKRTNRLLSAALVAVAFWAGHHHLQSRGVLQARERANRQRVAELNDEMKRAHQTIAEVRAAEQREEGARAALDRRRNGRPEGLAVVWFPVWMREQLRGFGMDDVQIRLNSAVPEAGLPGFKRTYWNVNLPPQAGLRSIKEALLAVEAIGQRAALVKILDCTFDVDPANPDRIAGALNVEALAQE